MLDALPKRAPVVRARVPPSRIAAGIARRRFTYRTPMYPTQPYPSRTAARLARFARPMGLLSLSLLPALAACDAARANEDPAAIQPEGQGTVARQEPAERCPVSPAWLAHVTDTLPRHIAATTAPVAGDTGSATLGTNGSNGAVIDSVKPRMSRADSLRLESKKRWARAQTAIERRPGAILPGCRILAYYGNPLSRRMGALGEFQVDTMLAKLDAEIARWQKADTTVKTIPALHLIAVVAQGSAGRDGKWRMRMPDTLIDRVAGWAERKDALLFLDIQVGLSTIQDELPRLDKYLERPNVHLGIDPEFSMKDGTPPGKKIGTYDAKDINWVIGHLDSIVTAKGLPPKVLVVHRFTRKMVTNSPQIRPTPNVQFVMHMDGWGGKTLKEDSYKHYVVNEPVQFTGFKLFYFNDQRIKGTRVMTADEVIALEPKPMYIQYQ